MCLNEGLFYKRQWCLPFVFTPIRTRDNATVSRDNTTVLEPEIMQQFLHQLEQ